MKCPLFGRGVVRPSATKGVLMAVTATAVERAMTYQQVIMRVRAGSLSWLQAADILDIYPQSLRRWRARYEQDPKLPLAPAISASHHTEDDSSAIGVARIARRSLEPR